jgi:hypothetical protein
MHYNFNLIEPDKAKTYKVKTQSEWTRLRLAGTNYAKRNGYIYIRNSNIKQNSKGMFFTWDYTDKTKSLIDKLGISSTGPNSSLKPIFKKGGLEVIYKVIKNY